MTAKIKKIRQPFPSWVRGCLIAPVASICMMTTAETLLWSEEFNYTSAPDSSVWSYDLGSGGWGNQERQNYTSNQANVWVNGSNLVITALRSGNNFTSARIKTQDKITFKYGRIEARIQTPDLANGLWPAFWTLGNNFPTVGWPNCGEIDVMEMGHKDAITAGIVNRRVGSHAHWGSIVDGGWPNYGDDKDYASDINDTFVVYRMEWTPYSITTYINNQQIWTMGISSIQEFQKPHFLILNLAVGGTYPDITDPALITAPFPAEYKVDWIRIYDNGHTELTVPPGPSTPYSGTPLSIPGTIEAENYDNGGENAAYHDVDAVNTGGSYRTSEGVDIEVCSDTGGGYNVTHTVAGEWLKYTVDVATADDYTITSRVARGTTGTGVFHIEVDGVDVTGPISVENTGGWQTWVDKTSIVTLGSGEQVVEIVIDAGDVNINRLDFVQLMNSPPVFTSDPINKPNAVVNVAYSDTLVGTATDVDAGDILTYDKISGPAWLNVAPNGTLSGTPGAGDLGTNVFSVLVFDIEAAVDTATLIITVEAAPAPPVLSIQVAGSGMEILWPSSYTAYSLYSSTNLLPPVAWSAVTNTPILQGDDWMVTMPMVGTPEFFRLEAP